MLLVIIFSWDFIYFSNLYELVNSNDVNLLFSAFFENVNITLSIVHITASNFALIKVW